MILLSLLLCLQPSASSPVFAQDPGSPAISRPQDVIAHLSSLKKSYAGDRAPVNGVVPAGGALTKELLPLFYPLGYSWVAVGMAEGAVSSGPWQDAHGVAFLPFTPL